MSLCQLLKIWPDDFLKDVLSLDYKSNVCSLGRVKENIAKIKTTFHKPTLGVQRA